MEYLNNGFVKAASLQQLVEFIENEEHLMLHFEKVLGFADCKALANALRDSLELTHLSLHWNQIGPKGIVPISEALIHTASLTSLAINFNGISAEGARHIAHFLRENPPLTDLSLENNNLELKGVQYITDALVRNTRLASISLRHNNIRSNAAKLLSTALKENSSLTSVNLGNNAIGNRGTRALADALKISVTLANLNLRDNGISDDGAKFLAEALKSNASLVELNLSNNGISKKGAHIIADAARINSTLSALHIQHNRMDRRGSSVVENAVKHNMGRSQRTVVASKYRTVQEVLNDNYETQSEAFFDALSGDGAAEWRRSKLMVVGEGQAGKSATVRSLLDMEFSEEWNSTVGIKITEAMTGRKGPWRAVETVAYATQLANRLAVQRLSIQKRGKKKRTVLSARSTDSNTTDINNLNSDSHSNLDMSERSWAQSVASAREKSYSAAKKKKNGAEERLSYDVNVRKLYKFNRDMLVEAKGEKESIRFSIWDYGGQQVFQSSHHVFLTKHGVYCIIFDMHDLAHNPRYLDTLNYWMNSIDLHAEGAPKILVGTFADRVMENATVHALFRTVIQPLIKQHDIYAKKCFEISNHTGLGIVQLRAAIEEAAKSQDFVHNKVSIKWMRALDLVTLQGTKTTFNSFREICGSLGISKIEEVVDMLSVFHQLGALIWFDKTEALRALVVTDPQWLVLSIGKLIRDPDLHDFSADTIQKIGLTQDVENLFNEGIASRDLLEWLWEQDQVEYLVDLLSHLMLISEWRFSSEESSYLIPSMIKRRLITTQYNTINLDLNCFFHFEFLPDGVFERLICLCVNLISKDNFIDSEEHELFSINDDFSINYEFDGESTDTEDEDIHHKQTTQYNTEIYSPKLGQSEALFFFAPSIPVFIWKPERTNTIQCLMRNTNKASYTIGILESMMKKVRTDIMGHRFKWQLMVETKRIKTQYRQTLSKVNLNRSTVNSTVSALSNSKNTIISQSNNIANNKNPQPLYNSNSKLNNNNSKIQYQRSNSITSDTNPEVTISDDFIVQNILLNQKLEEFRSQAAEFNLEKNILKQGTSATRTDETYRNRKSKNKRELAREKKLLQSADLQPQQKNTDLQSQEKDTDLQSQEKIEKVEEKDDLQSLQVEMDGPRKEKTRTTLVYVDVKEAREKGILPWARNSDKKDKDDDYFDGFLDNNF